MIPKMFNLTLAFVFLLNTFAPTFVQAAPSSEELQANIEEKLESFYSDDPDFYKFPSLKLVLEAEKDPALKAHIEKIYPEAFSFKKKNSFTEEDVISNLYAKDKLSFAWIRYFLGGMDAYHALKEDPSVLPYLFKNLHSSYLQYYVNILAEDNPNKPEKLKEMQGRELSNYNAMIHLLKKSELKTKPGLKEAALVAAYIPSMFPTDLLSGDWGEAQEVYNKVKQDLDLIGTRLKNIYDETEGNTSQNGLEARGCTRLALLHMKNMEGLNINVDTTALKNEAVRDVQSMLERKDNKIETAIQYAVAYMMQYDGNISSLVRLLDNRNRYFDYTSPQWGQGKAHGIYQGSLLSQESAWIGLALQTAAMYAPYVGYDNFEKFFNIGLNNFLKDFGYTQNPIYTGRVRFHTLDMFKTLYELTGNDRNSRAEFRRLGWENDDKFSAQFPRMEVALGNVPMHDLNIFRYGETSIQNAAATLYCDMEVARMHVRDAGGFSLISHKQAHVIMNGILDVYDTVATEYKKGNFVADYYRGYDFDPKGRPNCTPQRVSFLEGELKGNAITGEIVSFLAFDIIFMGVGRALKWVANWGSRSLKASYTAIKTVSQAGKPSFTTLKRAFKVQYESSKRWSKLFTDMQKSGYQITKTTAKTTAQTAGRNTAVTTAGSVGNTALQGARTTSVTTASGLKNTGLKNVFHPNRTTTELAIEMRAPFGKAQRMTLSPESLQAFNQKGWKLTYRDWVNANWVTAEGITVRNAAKPLTAVEQRLLGLEAEVLEEFTEKGLDFEISLWGKTNTGTILSQEEILARSAAGQTDDIISIVAADTKVSRDVVQRVFGSPAKPHASYSRPITLADQTPSKQLYLDPMFAYETPLFQVAGAPGRLFTSPVGESHLMSLINQGKFRPQALNWLPWYQNPLITKGRALAGYFALNTTSYAVAGEWHANQQKEDLEQIAQEAESEYKDEIDRAEEYASRSAVTSTPIMDKLLAVDPNGLSNFVWFYPTLVWEAGQTGLAYTLDGIGSLTGLDTPDWHVNSGLYADYRKNTGNTFYHAGFNMTTNNASIERLMTQYEKSFEEIKVAAKDGLPVPSAYALNEEVDLAVYTLRDIWKNNDLTQQEKSDQTQALYFQVEAQYQIESLKAEAATVLPTSMLQPVNQQAKVVSSEVKKLWENNDLSLTQRIADSQKMITSFTEQIIADVETYNLQVWKMQTYAWINDTYEANKEELSLWGELEQPAMKALDTFKTDSYAIVEGAGTFDEKNEKILQAYEAFTQSIEQMLTGIMVQMPLADETNYTQAY